MHAAQVAEWGQTPKYIEVDTPAPPPADSDTTQVKVLAAGLSQVVRSRAAGTHYSSKSLPHRPGVDGVGLTPSGQAVYFFAMGHGGGSYADFVNVSNTTMWPLPEGLEPTQVAGLFNPAMSSWMALRARTSNLPPNFTALIMGATSASGTIAITLARHLGAGKVIGAARNSAALQALNLDERITLQDSVQKTDYSTLGNVDVILDYVYGEPTLHLLKELKSRSPVQHVHIGSLASPNMEIPGALLRSKDITIRGAGPGSWSMGHLGKETPALLEAIKGVKSENLKVVKLQDVETVWGDKGDRLVFVP